MNAYMSLLPKKSLAAIEAITYISLQQAEKAVSSKEISEYMGVSLRYLEQLMQKLVKSGILKGLRGAQGGYVLGRDRRKITIEDIYHATIDREKSESANESDLAEKLISAYHSEILESARQKMQAITLQDLYDSALKLGISVKKKSSSDFII
jgi:Rrf2 family iron-sulfur cluster assembly transcriptional regulator